ncbi:MAG TPA: tetratricopeptide repeat protein, partial [Candidatus Eisenbacteria bacterium]|nr:tetratricopeptide repeat protein [Candidatus Eisenbacteria bacterium]
AAANEPVEALAAIDAALDAAPRWPDLHVQRARLLLSRPGRDLSTRAEARKALDTALRLHPDYAAARLERALLDAAEGRLGEAIDRLGELAREHPGEAHVFEQGLDKLRHADVDGAATLLSNALRVTAGSDDPLGTARECLAQDEPARALAVLRAALPGREGYPDLHLLIGAAELELGHHDDAVASFGRALALKPELHAARAQLARALEALGETAQAAEQVALVLAHDPSHPEAGAMQARWSRRTQHSARLSRRRKGS